MSEVEEHVVSEEEETRKSLERMQSFDANSLSRERDLGSQLNFKPVIEPAKRLVNLYRQVSLNILEDLPENHLTTIRNQANDDYSRFAEILEFTTEQESPHISRDNLIKKIEEAYHRAFNNMYQLISYSMSKSADFKRLETDAQALLQSVKDKTSDLTTELEGSRNDAQRILDDIRRIAAEQGVTQQAIYFQGTASEHEELAGAWQRKTTYWAVALGLYALLSIFLHKIVYLAPENPYQTVQLALGKTLLFAVLSYMLYLSSRNYMANKHNAIVNQHRQLALMTYTALVDAAKDTDNKEIILTHASSCIFSPQPTGYSKDSSFAPSNVKSVIELLGNPFSGAK